MEWAVLRKSAAEYFGDSTLVRGLNPGDVLTLSTDSKALYVGPIDWTWGAGEEEIETKLDSVKADYLFRCNQVEILIHEAGTLIERALGDVAQGAGKKRPVEASGELRTLPVPPTLLVQRRSALDDAVCSRLWGAAGAGLAWVEDANRTRML